MDHRVLDLPYQSFRKTARAECLLSVRMGKGERRIRRVDPNSDGLEALHEALFRIQMAVRYKLQFE